MIQGDPNDDITSEEPFIGRNARGTAAEALGVIGVNTPAVLMALEQLASKGKGHEVEAANESLKQLRK